MNDAAMKDYCESLVATQQRIAEALERIADVLVGTRSAMTPPPTALTPEEQAAYQKFLARASARSSLAEREEDRDVLAIIRRLDKIMTSYEGGEK